MKLRPLIINDQVKASIKAVMDHAHAYTNVVNTHSVLEAIGRPDRAIGNDERFVCVVPIGYRCAYSVERQPIGHCRHISVSVLGGDAPNEMAFEAIMAEFGFTGGIKGADAVWLEDIGPRKVAINAVQRLPL